MRRRHRSGIGNKLGLLAGYWLALMTTGALRHEPLLVAIGVAGMV